MKNENKFSQAIFKEYNPLNSYIYAVAIYDLQSEKIFFLHVIYIL